jgi:hypothetical protein
MKFKVSIENISHYHGKLNKIFCANICVQGLMIIFFSSQIYFRSSFHVLAYKQTTHTVSWRFVKLEIGDHRTKM